MEVSQPERSREERDEQPENMEPMPVTLEVSQPERSRKDRDEQPENMERMLVTEETSRPERSIIEAHERPSKIPSKDREALTSFSTLTLFTLYPIAHQGLLLP